MKQIWSIIPSCLHFKSLQSHELRSSEVLITTGNVTECFTGEWFDYEGIYPSVDDYI